MPSELAVATPNASVKVKIANAVSRQMEAKGANEQMRCRIVIADDHPLVASSLTSLFGDESLFEIVGCVASGLDAVAAIKQHRPDLLFLDIDMPDGRGTEVYGECRRWSPQTKVIVLSGVREREILQQLFAAGADGVLTKATMPETIRNAVRTVLDNGRFLDPCLADDEDTRSSVQLTKRELQVLDLIANGLSNARIGERLGVSAKTIDGHRTNLMTKLGAHSVAELVVKAMRAGLLS